MWTLLIKVEFKVFMLNFRMLDHSSCQFCIIKHPNDIIYWDITRPVSCTGKLNPVPTLNPGRNMQTGSRIYRLGLHQVEPNWATKIKNVNIHRCAISVPVNLFTMSLSCIFYHIFPSYFVSYCKLTTSPFYRSIWTEILGHFMYLLKKSFI